MKSEPEANRRGQWEARLGVLPSRGPRRRRLMGPTED